MGRDIVWANLVVLILTLAAVSQNIPTVGIDPGALILLSMGTTIGGVGVVAGAEALKLIGILIERLAGWYVPRDPAGTEE